MGLTLWLIMGGIVGWTASIVMETDAKQDTFLHVAAGIYGAFIGGGMIAPLMDAAPGNDGIISLGLFVALIGALLMLALLRLFQRSYLP